MDCTIRIAKTKALISFADTAKLICVFIFAYAKIRFSHDAAQLIVKNSFLGSVTVHARHNLKCVEGSQSPIQ